MRIRRAITTAAIALAIITTAAGCGPTDNFRDLEGIDAQDPDLVEVYNNIDEHPNLAKVCIDGVAFVTTSRDFTSVMRVAEWDETCPAP